jgi:hypothetical protein
MKSTRLIVLGSALTIAACGGGDVFTPIDEPTGAARIDGANAQTAARVSYEAAVASGDLAGVGGDAGLSGSAPDGPSKAVVSGSPGNVLMTAVSLVPFGPDVYPCGQSAADGSITISGNLANPPTLTPGDTFRIEYDLCDEGFGEVIDGVVDLTVTDFAGDLLAGSYLLAMDAELTDLQVASIENTVTSNGDAAITLDTRAAPFIAAGVSGTSMTMDANTSSETLSNYSSDQTFDGNLDPAEYTLAAAGRLDSTQLPGVVNYSTGPNFAGFEASYPNTGELLVQGDASSVRLIAVDSTNVRIDIDSNGDGTVDETINTTWQELTSP